MWSSIVVQGTGNQHYPNSRLNSLSLHRAPTPEPDDDPLPGEHPVPQQEPVPSPFPEAPVKIVASITYCIRESA